MPDQAKPVSRPWRRFLRISLRGMIVVVLVVGGWLGWLVRTLGFSGRPFRRSRTQVVTFSTIGNVEKTVRERAMSRRG